MKTPTIEEVQTLEGRVFAMLSSAEVEIFRFYRDRGRKFGVAISLFHNVDPNELARAASLRQVEDILRRTNANV